ncbi:MAG: hypothetical protein M1827_004561 [Pycnora praestabilis]|nr:MAG: hypothetical protein M1827_004561 [Pycnora praestabilis]
MDAYLALPTRVQHLLHIYICCFEHEPQTHYEEESDQVVWAFDSCEDADLRNNPEDEPDYEDPNNGPEVRQIEFANLSEGFESQITHVTSPTVSNEVLERPAGQDIHRGWDPREVSNAGNLPCGNCSNCGRAASDGFGSAFNFRSPDWAVPWSRRVTLEQCEERLSRSDQSKYEAATNMYSDEGLVFNSTYHFGLFLRMIGRYGDLRSIDEEIHVTLWGYSTHRYMVGYGLGLLKAAGPLGTKKIYAEYDSESLTLEKIAALNWQMPTGWTLQRVGMKDFDDYEDALTVFMIRERSSDVEEPLALIPSASAMPLRIEEIE